MPAPAQQTLGWGFSLGIGRRVGFLPVFRKGPNLSGKFPSESIGKPWGSQASAADPEAVVPIDRK